MVINNISDKVITAIKIYIDKNIGKDYMVYLSDIKDSSSLEISIVIDEIEKIGYKLIMC